MVSGLQSRTLGECARFLSGGTPAKNNPGYWQGDIPWVSCKDMKVPRLYDSEDHLSEEGSKNGTRLVSPETILIVVRGMILAKEFPVAMAMREVAFNQDLKALRCKDGVDPWFLYYWLLANSYEIRGLADEAAHGTKRLQSDRLLSLEVKLPPLETQRKIASILSAYDDLIENNTRRIKILEEMAQTIYREWFVNFRFPGHEKVKMVDSPLGRVPEGWEVVPLKAIVENRREATNAGEHLRWREYVPIDCLSRKSMALQESKSWEEAQSSLILFEKGDVLFGAMRSYFHKVTIAPFDGVTRTTCFVLQPKSPELFAYATLIVFQEETVKYASSHARGATIPYAVWDGSLAEMKVLLPPKPVLERFEETVFPMLKLIQGAFPKLRNLRQTRDLLLPKLISGEIDLVE